MNLDRHLFTSALEKLGLLSVAGLLAIPAATLTGPSSSPAAKIHSVSLQKTHCKTLTTAFGGKGYRENLRRIERQHERSRCLRGAYPSHPISPPTPKPWPNDPLLTPLEPPFIPGLVPGGSQSRRITTLSFETQGTKQQNLPVTFGHPFTKGDVPAGETLTLVNRAAIANPLQVDAKATHSDGSLRFAVLTAVPEEISGEYTLRASATAGGDSLGLTVEDLLEAVDSGFDATVRFSGDANASVSAADLLRQSRIDRVYLQGPQALEVHTSSPVPGHEHLATYFHIRLFADRRVRVDVIVENGWLQVPGPGLANYQASIEVGDQTVFGPTDMAHPHHQRWHQRYWWKQSGEADPQTHAKINRQYLIDTGAVPGYMDLPPEPNEYGDIVDLDGLTQVTPPLGSGPQTDNMPSAGYQPGIGLLPRWCAFYVTSSGDRRAYDATLAGDDGGGGYGVHYRDEQTGGPLSIAGHPQLTLNGYTNLPPRPRDNESNGHTADTAHQPSIGYCGYLLSGDYYYLEELQFWATYNYLWLAEGYYGSGLNRHFHDAPVRTPEVRQQAWGLRTLGQAAYITPDDNPLKTELETYLTNVLNHYSETYSDNPQANNLGVLQARNDHMDEGWLLPWQNDFFVQTLGYLHSDLGFEAAAPMESYMYRSVVDRIGLEGIDQFCYRSASSYIVIAYPPGSEEYNDHTQFYFDSWGEVYSQTYGENGDCTEGDTIERGTPDEAKSYLGNLQPAISYAVDSGFAGSAEAYARLTSASNYPPSSNTNGFRNIPQWAIAPGQ